LTLTDVRAEPKSAHAMYSRALLVSLTNPKTLFFYGAFFPQFVVMGHDVGLQVALLSATFVFIAIAVDSSWAVLANRARRFLAMHGKLRNRISGGILIGAGIGLAFARRS
jgi:threonine/homoserine/homoserine lactone efflux protein